MGDGSRGRLRTRAASSHFLCGESHDRGEARKREEEVRCEVAVWESESHDRGEAREREEEVRCEVAAREVESHDRREARERSVNILKITNKI